MTHQICRGVVALCATLVLGGAAYAQTDILSASANATLTSLTITGRALQPVSGSPLVSLGSQRLAVVNFSSTQITASLPAGLTPGSYDLAVTARGAANFDVTIGEGVPGPVGPAGPAGPPGAPGPALSLPFGGSVAASNDSAFSVINTAGTGMVVVGAGGIGASILGGVEGGTGQAGVGALGGGGSGVATAGPAFSGTGGIGDTKAGDGIDVTGGASSGSVGGNGVFAIGGGSALFGGSGVNALGANGDSAGDGVYGQGGDTISGCTVCGAGAGGTFFGGYGPALLGGDGIDAFAGSGNTVGGYGIYAQGNGPGQAAGGFVGDVYVIGNLSKSGGSFQIDHPLDPANKYLYHSFVESPDMKNVYDGTIVTDGGGFATVALPDWFQALNSDYRYQLTVIGQFAHAIVASEVSNNTFVIRTDRPNVKVSWQVTGIRQDAWAKAHRIPVEAEKDKADQGRYLHPELFDHAGEPSIAEVHHPRPKQRHAQ